LGVHGPYFSQHEVFGVYVSGFGTSRTLLDVPLIQSVASLLLQLNGAHASTFECVQLCSEGKILHFSDSQFLFNLASYFFISHNRCNNYVTHIDLSGCLLKIHVNLDDNQTQSLMRQALVEPQWNEIIYELCLNNKGSQGLDLTQAKKWTTFDGVINLFKAHV